jgi:hypothetical protein
MSAVLFNHIVVIVEAVLLNVGSTPLAFWLRGADERQFDVGAYWRCLSIRQSTPSVVDSRSEFLSAWRGIEWIRTEWNGVCVTIMLERIPSE